MARASALQAEGRWFESNREHQQGTIVMREELKTYQFTCDFCNKKATVTTTKEICEMPPGWVLRSHRDIGYAPDKDGYGVVDLCEACNAKTESKKG